MDPKTERLIHLIKQAQELYSKDHFVIAVPSFISKKFVAYCSMKEDLELILQYIAELRQNPAGVVKSALCYSMISLYGKCFTDATQNSFPKLEPSNLFQDGDQNGDTHNYLMELRHQFIAHRGDTENEVGISYILIPEDNNMDKMQVRFSQLKLTGFSAEDVLRIEVLVKYLIEKLLEKIQKTGQKVHDAMMGLFTPQQLSLMLLNGAK